MQDPQQNINAHHQESGRIGRAIASVERPHRWSDRIGTTRTVGTIEQLGRAYQRADVLDKIKNERVGKACSKVSNERSSV